MATNTDDPRSEVSPAQRFLEAFNAIEQRLRFLLAAENRQPFSHLINEARREHLITYLVADQLHAFTDLRNAIVHNEYHDNKPIADPRADVIADIEKVRDSLNRDRLALSALHQEKVVSFDMDTTVREALAIMKDTGYPCFPVYGQGRFHFLVTQALVARWIAADVGDNDRVDATRISQLAQYANHRDRVVLVSRDITAVEALSMLTKRDETGLSPVALLINEHGKATEKPIGIVMAEDIPKLLPITHPLGG